jgi:NAD(P)-dependent dehydrogenase (short-subunit alcohol dehydrogenase family)
LEVARTVVVTGASAGVGRAVARELGRRGDRVALLARGKQRLEEARQEVEGAGGRAIALEVDVADFDQVERAAQQIERELGPIDCWINNAMVTVLSPVHEMKPEEFDRVTRVTYLGAVHGTLAALRRMRARGRGHVIQVGSALAYRSIPLQSAYCAAKHAMRAFTDSLRSELIHDGIDVRLTMVQLPAMNTPQFEWCRTRMPNQPQPVPPIFEPELAARAIVSVIGKRRRELFVGNSTVKTVLGSRFVNGWLDRYLAKRAYEGQQTDSPVAAEHEDNLFRPAAGYYGARGRFGSAAKTRSLQAWAALHRRAIASGALAALIGIGGAIAAARSG